MDYYCVLCKGTIKGDDPGLMKLDPCSLIIISNCDQDESEQDRQLFYCHFDCFRKIVDDDSLIHIMKTNAETGLYAAPFLEEHKDLAEQPEHEPIQNALEKIPREYSPEEEQEVEYRLNELVKAVEMFGESAGMWKRLLAYPRGRWIELANLIMPEDDLYRWIEALDSYMKPREDILITWVDDYYNRTRPFENNRLVLLALDSGYEWMRKIIIPLERPDKPDPRCIP